MFLLQLLRDLGEESKIENSKEFNNKLSNVISELRTNQTDIGNPEQEEKKDEHKFDDNLFDPKMKNLYSEYHVAMGKNANLGTKLTRDFEEFVTNRENMTPEDKQEIIDKINTINNENEIENLIKQHLEDTNHAWNRIMNDFKENIGLTTSLTTIRKIEQKHGLESRDVIKANEAHPNLIENIFETIDTKDKAYWLGLMYSDGGISIDSRTEAKRLDFDLKSEDSELIERFVDFLGGNKEKIRDRDWKLKDGGISLGKGIYIWNNKLCDDLMKHGVMLRKSKIIEYPEHSLKTREDNLSFLLGCFDGDGTEGTSCITSGSNKFLEQIKDKFNIPNKIGTDIREDKNSGNTYKNHNLYLGAKLFNEMLDSYENSLERKRIRLDLREGMKLRDKESLSQKISQNAWRGGTEKKLNITAEDLKKSVWEKPLYQIAKDNGVSITTVRNWCKKYGIKRPSQGY